MNTDGYFVCYERTYLAAYMANMLVLMVRSSHIRGAISCGTTSVQDSLKICNLGSRAVCSHRHSDLRIYKGSRIFESGSQQIFWSLTKMNRRSQWPRGLRRRSAAASLLRLWVRIPPGAWMAACCECCVLSGRGLCDELITCPEDSYRLWCVVVCDLETS